MEKKPKMYVNCKNDIERPNKVQFEEGTARNLLKAALWI